MKKFVYLLIGAAMIFTAAAQQPKATLVPASDLVRLQILNVDAHAFPKVAVSFKAERKNGVPVWELRRNQLQLLEEGKACEVTALRAVSVATPVYVSIVVDHSGSMEEDPAQLYDAKGNPLYSVDANNDLVVSDTYVSPMDHAKKAIKTFTAGFDHKDQISITGFGSNVDQPLALTNDHAKIDAMVDAMQPAGKTALYDGMMTGLDQISKSYGIRALVVLTDGQDNRSHASWNEVAARAVKEEIPIYIIGLGEVCKETLQQLAAETKGQFFYTTSANSLESIYSTISQRVQSVFQLEYLSANQQVSSRRRDISLSASIKGAAVVGAWATAKLPASMMTTVANTETEQVEMREAASTETPVPQPVNIKRAAAETPSNYWLYGNAAIAAVIALSATAYLYRRAQQAPKQSAL